MFEAKVKQIKIVTYFFPYTKRKTELFQEVKNDRG